ncbi:hypothetical protein ACFO3D_05740 [Virgibacillus kekensis]|uniref:Ornithine cyclodeaminase n=1 Tax=Virgibacillus kekensis TaxID=202261 RepID=A0ABV9DFX7_9BACI
MVGVGSFQPTTQEFPRSLYQLTDHIFIDTEDAVKESGDLTVPLEKGWITSESIQSMAGFIADKDKFHFKNGASIVFKSTGMALFDVVVANKIYKRAIEKGVGTILE